MARRKAPVTHVFSQIWDKLGREQAEIVAKTLLIPFVHGEVDSIYLVYNEFKSAITQRVVVEPLFPLPVVEQAEPLHDMDRGRANGIHIRAEQGCGTRATSSQIRTTQYSPVAL